MASISEISSLLGLLCIGIVLIPGLGYFPPPGGVDLGSTKGLGIWDDFVMHLTEGERFEDWTESPWIRFKKDMAWSRLKKNSLCSGSWARRRKY